MRQVRIAICVFKIRKTNKIIKKAVLHDASRFFYACDKLPLHCHPERSRGICGNNNGEMVDVVKESPWKTPCFPIKVGLAPLFSDFKVGAKELHSRV